MASPSDHKDEFIPVNQVLNLKPKLGPIPGEQVVPWVLILVVSYLVCQGIFQFSWVATSMMTIWGSATWWILTGDASWRFLSKFVGVPTWTRGQLIYRSLLAPAQLVELDVKKRKKQGRKAKKIRY